ncbi:MAG: putative porin [Bacteroidales bacterium]|nr:putative porin [Bacteroidales bacterium]
MKKLVAKIWVPTVLVMLAAVQSFGIDIHRSGKLFGFADTLVLTRLDDTTAVDIFAIDSLLPHTDSLMADSLGIDTLALDTLILTARDTIKVPDSLKETDPFFYKYYIAVKDSLTRVQVRDSLIAAGDTLELLKLDSLYIKDSTETAKAAYDAWYASLSRRERKKEDARIALPGLIAKANRKLEIKDSIKTYKDSVLAATPRILETFAVPDSMQYKRIIMWDHDRHFNDVRLQNIDTTYNTHFYDLPFMNEDVNASWLGVAGSPVQYYNYFKRQDIDNAIFFSPYSPYTYTPENLPQYNTKTPHTELAYWGTLFSNKEKEESNIRILTTQNITPELNLTLEYHRFGGNGMLRREDIDNRTFVASTNYLGKKYLMHAGFIYNRIDKSENGGVVDPYLIRDTLVDAREIDVYLSDASTNIKRNTVFLDQTYRIPFDFINKIKENKEQKKQLAVRDSIMATGDSIAIASFMEKMKSDSIAKATLDSLALAADTLGTGTHEDITTAFIGHSSEYSVFRKGYHDVINNELGRQFYNDRFYINPTTSSDSLRVMKFENRFFMRLQPWSDEAIVSKIDVGLGDKLASYYSFRPVDYLEGSHNVLQNSVYLYAGADGMYKKYMTWKAFGKYNFAGFGVNDFEINGDIAFNAYPFRRAKQSPLTLKAHFETSLKEPDYYQQHLFTNHYKWNNDFGKISTTKVEGSVSIPRWKLDASFGYALLNNNIYYDTLGIARQNTKPMSVMTASLRKDFNIWNIHFDNQALVQFSSDPDVMPLPLLALNLRYYYQFDIVKKVMQMQVGLNGTFTTKWYAPAYNPVLGVFHNQNKEQYGNSAVVDAFVNVQWKRACIFIKVINVNMGWPFDKADYFTAHGYISSQRALKIGISWPFYVQPGRSTTSTGSAGSAGGGGGRAASGGRSTGMQGGRSASVRR